MAKIAALEQWKVNIRAIPVLKRVDGAQRLMPVLKEEVYRSMDENVLVEIE